MKTIFKGNNFAIVWNIIDSSTHTPFDFSGMKVEVGLYSECCKKAIKTYNISNGTIEFEVESEELQNGVYNLMCRYSTENEQAYCIYKRAFQITGKPEFASNVETIILESKASHIDATDHDDPIPDFENCQLIAQELFKENFRLPQLTAHRAIADEHGNRIADTYVSREAVTKHIRNTYNQQFLENPPLITEGYITPQMLSDETRQLLEESGATINNLPDGEDLQSVHGVLKLANKQHNPNSYSGLGRQYLRKNIVAGQNILTQSMLQWPNTIYIIKYDFTLGEDITIPANCVLQFDGGSISGNNTLHFNNTLIEEQINSICVPVSGTIKNEIIHSSTFGVSTTNLANSNASKLNNILQLRTEEKDLSNSTFIHVVFDWVGTVDIDTTINVSSGVHISGISGNTALYKNNNDGDIDAVINLQGGWITIENIRLWKGNNTYGVYCKDLHRAEIKNVIVAQKNYGYYFYHCWLITINEICANGCDTGFHVVGPSTTFTVNRLFIQNQKDYGINISHLGYSTFINCANDSAKSGICIKVNNSSCSFIGCGMESTNISCNYFITEYSKVAIVGGRCHTCKTLPEGATNPSVFTIYGSKVTVQGTHFGHTGDSPVPFVRIADNGVRISSNITFIGIYKEGRWEPDVFSNDAKNLEKAINYIGDGMWSKADNNFPLLKTDEGSISFNAKTTSNVYEREINLGGRAGSYFAQVFNVKSFCGRVGTCEVVDDKIYVSLQTPVYRTYLKDNGFLVRINQTFYKCEAETVDTNTSTRLVLSNNEVVPEGNLLSIYRYPVVQLLGNVLSIDRDSKKIKLDSWNADSPNFYLSRGERFVYFCGNKSGVLNATAISVTAREITFEDLSEVPVSETIELYFLISDSNKRTENRTQNVLYCYEQFPQVAKDLSKQEKYLKGQLISAGDVCVVADNKLNNLVYYDIDALKYGTKDSIPSTARHAQLYVSEGRLWHYILGKGWVDYLGNDVSIPFIGSISNRSDSAVSGSFYIDTTNSNKVNLWIKVFDKWLSVPVNNAQTYGETDARPTSEYINIGFQYFDTILNKPIWWTGEKWVDATGAEV